MDIWRVRKKGRDGRSRVRQKNTLYISLHVDIKGFSISFIEGEGSTAFFFLSLLSAPYCMEELFILLRR